MNLILMRTKVDHLNGFWEPHATSTPLKKLPAQLEVKNKAQKQDQPEKTKFVDSKSRKNRPKTYFDPSSSSSSDESGEIKRPIIKLSSKENNTKVLLMSEEHEPEEIDTVDIGQNRNFHNSLSIKNGVKTRKKISTIENTKNKNDKEAQNKKNRSQRKFNCNAVDAFTDSDEENNISNKCKKNKHSLKENNSYLKTTVRSINCSKSENSRHPSDFNEIERKKLQKVTKAKKLLIKSEKVKVKSNKNSQALRSYQKISTGQNRLPKLYKETSKKFPDGADSLKNLIENSDSKNNTKKTLKQMVNTVNPPCILENKFNLSHQLFSDSTEQEYINILDLTSEETNEATVNVQRESNFTCQPFLWPYNNSHKDCNEMKDEERPKRKKQTPQKYWMPKVQPSKLPNTITETEAIYQENLPKNDSLILNDELLSNKEETFKGKNTENSYKIKNCVSGNQKDQTDNKEQEVCDRNVTANETLADDLKSFKNQMVTEVPSNSTPEVDINIQKNEACKKNPIKCVKEKTAVNSSEKSVFKKLDELSFNGDDFGCSAVQCWNVNNVKCGVFKLKMKSQFACQTLHNNSHLGGVLVKGHLKMRIGLKEQDLKEGDMVFVPPLTEWRATNIGKCESVFYYWCGRFGKSSHNSQA